MLHRSPLTYISQRAHRTTQPLNRGRFTMSEPDPVEYPDAVWADDGGDDDS